MNRRVVVTGLGAISPVGNDAPTTWKNLVAGRSGIARITHFDPSEYSIQIGAEVKEFDAGEIVDYRAARRMDLASLYAVVAADEAVTDAGLKDDPPEPDRTGIIVGSAVGGITTMLEMHERLIKQGPRRLTPYFLQNMLVDSPSGQVAIHLGYTGPNFAVVAACATGTNAVGEAAEMIGRGDADVVVAGGTEALIVPLILAGFIVMRALAAEPEEGPEYASRPFDKTRDGFVLAEGCGILILEEYERAKRRGANIYAEVIGHVSGNDAFHMAAPREDGGGPIQVLSRLVEKAKVDPTDVEYINAHGTSTPINDRLETKAIKEVFGDHAYDMAVSSIKSMIGHPMGAAGAVEAVITALVVKHGIIPPTINYRYPDPECDLDYVPNEAREQRVDVAISNSIGLGGHNGGVMFRRV